MLQGAVVPHKHGRQTRAGIIFVSSNVLRVFVATAASVRPSRGRPRSGSFEF